MPLPATVVVPVGDFLMGGIPEDKFVSAVELPQRPIHLEKPFALGTTPVTQSQWIEVMGQLPTHSIPSPNPLCPVVSVHFADITHFLTQLSSLTGTTHRLPSEAEWEYACRAGSTSVVPQGSHLGLEDANFLYNELGETIGTGGLTPVGQYPPNTFGLQDMLGNACEWTADHWQPNLSHIPADGTPTTTKPSPHRRTIRGGAWDHLPRILRPSWRDWAPEEARWDNLGFRIAIDL